VSKESKPNIEQLADLMEEDFPSMFVVKWDLIPIGGWLTFHGPFASEDEAQSWINKAVVEEPNAAYQTTILAVDEDFFKEYNVVDPEKTATHDQMYR